jgi:LAS superfamily LD-carboxypeptidase LdcB
MVLMFGAPELADETVAPDGESLHHTGYPGAF